MENGAHIELAFYKKTNSFNPLNTDLNPICHLLVLLGAHHILHVGRIRVNWSLLIARLTSVCLLLPHKTFV
jgi:hypothetical protein